MKSNFYHIRTSYTFYEATHKFLLNSYSEEDVPNMESLNPSFASLFEGTIKASSSCWLHPQVFGIFKNLFKAYNTNYWEFQNSILFDLFDSLMARYEGQYFVAIAHDEDATDSDKFALLKKEFELQFGKFLRYANDTAPKYLKILEIYDTNKNKLMDKLSSSVEGSVDSNNKGTNRFNDTPQTHPSTFDEFEDADYTTDITINKGEVHSENESTTEWDDKNIMARISEIQESYQNLMDRWVGEFDKFFWEE